MKIGIDFHGVVTDNPKLFMFLSRLAYFPGVEIHIMTGSRRATFDKELKQLEKDINVGNLEYHYLKFTHFFSISDYHHKHNPDKIDVSDPDHPHIADKELWDKTKAEYARWSDLDLVIDDNADYLKYFTTPCMQYIGSKLHKI